MILSLEKNNSVYTIKCLVFGDIRIFSGTITKSIEKIAFALKPFYSEQDVKEIIEINYKNLIDGSQNQVRDSIQ